jgi:predicted AAA+ superfamily ATPase
MYSRLLQNQIQASLFQGYVLILYGARQVGKTTLINQLLANNKDKTQSIFSGDDIDIREKLKPTNFEKLISQTGTPDILIIDEAQRVENIRLTLKILHDNRPQMQIIATGSSSFDLANQINEPLTGRSLEFVLYPLSILEVAANGIEMDRAKEKFMQYGSYPNIYQSSGDLTQKLLKNLTNQYLYKDILQFETIQKPQAIHNLLKLLAYQVGNEVSLQELANKLDLNKRTVSKYIDLLEKSFIVFSMTSFSKNQRKEIGKSTKIYFYDLGVRNQLIENFSELRFRNDIGALWENFCILERRKYLEYNQINVNSYFWRNYQQQEIDYIEEKDGVLNCFEFKWNDRKKAKLPNSFKEAYPDHTFKVINGDNWLEMIT